ncbi:MAG TPA: pseudouridine synthase [Bacteroidaceae bacterium]|nr:pseudouridine synthase [Bacteroidaceae bacterium]
METEKGNQFFEEDNRQDEFENKFNRFDHNSDDKDDMRNERRGQRPRFVRVDVDKQSNYSRVGRQPQQGENQNRSYNQDRQYANNRNRPYNRNRSYNQDRFRNQDNSYHSYNQEDKQIRFYRERVQWTDQKDVVNNFRGGAAGQKREYRSYPNEGEYRTNYGSDNRSYGQKFKKSTGFKKKMDNRGKRIEYPDIIHDPNEPIRLNKYLANAGVCSRREADEFISAGVVKVNGKTITELGTKIKRGDNVFFHDQLVSLERKIYILLNKPKDCVTTVDDPQERKTVMDHIKGACSERVYPVGRLDRNTTGVLLLTNDGEMASKLTHPRFMKKKIYHVRVDKNVSAEDMQNLLNGVDIGDGVEARADEISYVNEDKTQVGIEIHSGRNRVVRKMFDALGYRVTKLDRVQFAGLTKKRLRRGDWRFLTEKEVNMLRMGAYE